jgi:hypothetical protein
VKLFVEALEAKLRAIIRKLLDFSQETFLSSELCFQLVEHLTMNVDPAAKLIDTRNKTTPLGLELAITEDFDVSAAVSRHGLDFRSGFG